MQLLLSYLKKNKAILLFALILATVNQVFSLLDPQIFRLIIDNYASKTGEYTSQEFLRGVGTLLLAFVGVAFVSRVAKNFQDYFVSIVTQRVGAQLYEDSIRHAFSLPFSSFEDQRSGELLQKLQKARADAQQLISQAVNLIFTSLVSIVFVVGYAFFVNTLVGFVYFAIIPVMGFLMFWLTRSIKKAQKEIVTQTAILAGSTTETLRNVELVKSLGLENQEIQRLNSTNETILGLELKKIKRIRVLSFIQGTTVNGIRSLLLLMMLWLIFKGEISFGQFMSLYIYLFFVFGPLQELGNVANIYQEASASMDKLKTILDQPCEPKPENAVVVPEVRSIEFQNASFVYPNKSEAAVHDISLRLQPGTSVALVGPSGAGKSTIVKLLAGLYKPSSGALMINDVSASDIDYEDFRSHMGYVSQDTQLFAGTIRENLRFVRPEATDEECIDVLRRAAVAHIVERSPDGLNVKIGEGGLKLSGGERQRLAIARALLRNPDLIIFDEATSSLDSLTEKEITDTIREIGDKNKNLITIMIAHRLSTISHADMIYVLERGKIVEQGNHGHLLKNMGLYAALWRQQS